MIERGGYELRGRTENDGPVAAGESERRAVNRIGQSHSLVRPRLCAAKLPRRAIVDHPLAYWRAVVEHIHFQVLVHRLECLDDRIDGGTDEQAEHEDPQGRRGVTSCPRLR